MTKRDPYIKPSLLRLEFTQDVAQACDPASCKTTTSSQGQCLPSQAVSCLQSSCNSVVAS
jgi:hypothetical protein